MNAVISLFVYIPSELVWCFPNSVFLEEKSEKKKKMKDYWCFFMVVLLHHDVLVRLLAYL